MPIRAKRERTQQVADCACDDCGTTVTMPAKHARPGRVIGMSGRPVMELLSEGEVVAKLRKNGWSYNKKGLLCPECAKAKAPIRISKSQPKETVIVTQIPKTETPAVRQPTREQRRQIVELLNTCYDTKAERYIGTDTDKTVADCIGGGVLFGWVAQVREEFFGPDGGNGEMEEVLQAIKTQRAALDAIQGTVDSVVQMLNGAASSLDKAYAHLAILERRLDQIKAAVGPKAGK